jgi:phosphoserine phosphatase
MPERNHLLVATLVASDTFPLSQDLIAKIVPILAISGAKEIRTDWLAKDKAADIFCVGLGADSLRNVLDDNLRDLPIDIIIQPAATRRKKFLIADMESTIIEQEMLDELATLIGCGDQVATITRRAMNGELDFSAALKERVAMLKGQPASILDDVSSRITLMAGARALITKMRDGGAVCWMVSGGFTCFVKPVAVLLNFDEAYGNNLVAHNGILTGEVTEPILDKNTKKSLLDNACKQLGFSRVETVAVGDGANDVPMLLACHEGGGLGVAYHAKPHVRNVIPNQINHTDLTTLLYAQGLVP